MRKLLNSLYILEETAYLTLDGENIVCRAEDSEKFRVPFRSWLFSLDPENDDKQEKFEQWQAIAKRITLDLGSELVAAAGDAAMVGHMIDETIYSAPKAYNIFLRDVSKIYQKI